MGNPVVRCPHCDREIGNNSIAAHVRGHDEALVEQRRLRKNARQAAYRRTLEGQATEVRRRRSPIGRIGHRRRLARSRLTETGRLAHAAHQAVAVALRRGELVRKACGRCGDPQSFAHHPRGYDRQHQLDVEWLCLTHHMEAHDRVAA